jgi:hypothetical protein
MIINVSTNQFQGLVFNLKTSKKLVRNDTMEGRPFTVVPMVMMTEGVLNGSNGPILYPEEELAKNPEVWNHKPVVVYHPTANGQGISACSPDVLTTQKIGVIMNTRWDNTAKRLTAEAWLEKTRMDIVDNRVSKAVANEETMELSTGLFTDNEVNPGEHNGRKYTMIARNHRPDHLAVLPDKIGACSMKDGAGFIRNEKGGLTGPTGENGMNGSPGMNYAELDQRTLTTNSIAHEALRELINVALREKFPAPKNGTPGYGYTYVDYTFDDFVIYSQDGKYFKIGYSTTNASVTLTGSPVEVLRATQFVTKDGGKVLASLPRPTYNKESRQTFATHQERVIAVLNAAGDLKVTAKQLVKSK